MPARHSHSRHPQGFVTVLVLMLLFMMLLMVVAYLRTMRAYSLVHQQTAPNSAVVLNQLTADLAAIIGEDGKIGPNGRQPNGQLETKIHEPYDYPWTCATQKRGTCIVRYPSYVKSDKGMGDPLLDDTWLAPLEPTSGVWDQVSNPFGSYLVYADAALTGIPKNPQTGEAVPSDAPAGAAIPDVAFGKFVKFQDLPTTDPRLVDTDGDGEGDALWFYPNRNVSGGLRYVAAVRIVDSSARLNLNTALGDLATAQDSPTGSPLKGEGPHEIKASTLDATLSLSANADSKAFRITSGPETAWNARMVSGARTDNQGAPTQSNRYSLVDEAQLRDLSGNLIDSNSLGVAPQLFDTASATGHYGAMPANSLRNRLTTLSGAADRAAPVPYSGTGSNASTTHNYYTGFTHRPGDLNLYQMDSTGNKNDQWWSNTIENYFYFHGTGYPGMQELFQGVDSTTLSDDYPFPEGFKQLFAGSGRPASDLPHEYQIQVGACLQDALERDNRPSMTWSWMGWKPLPIMTEFYLQMPYVVGAPYVKIPLGAATPVLVFPGTTLSDLSLKDIKNLAGCISWDMTPRYRSDVYFYTQTATQITFRYQAYANDAYGNWTRSANVTLTETPAGVVAVSPVAGKYIAGDHRNEDPTGWPGTDNNYAAFFGLPTAAGTDWNQGYINTVKNRTANDASLAITTGQFNHGDPRTSTEWRATGIAGVGSYAFELANPYSVPIRLNNLRFAFRRDNDRLYWNAAGWVVSTAPPSQNLANFIAAAPPAGMAQDAEGHYVLKPGERIVFYRNGLEFSGPGGARRRPMGGPAYVGAAPSPGTPAVTDISPLIATGAGVYKVDLGTAATAPDINGYPANAGTVATIELEVNTKNSAGDNYGWVPYNHMVFKAPTSGYDANHCHRVETNVPNQYQAAPGDLVYFQQDVRTFGVEEKLNLLQARPPCFFFGDIPREAGKGSKMPVDLGDVELRTNNHAVAGSGVLPNGSAKPYPTPEASVFGTAYGGHNNTAATMPLGHPTSGLNFLSYDSTPGTARISALGEAAKVSFRTPFGGPNGGNAMYSGQRQDIRDGSLFFNYVGIPADAATYPGTFPELMSAPAGPWTSATAIARDGAAANPVNGKERRDGTARVMDIGKIMMAGPIWWNFTTGNSTYRGTTANGGWGGAAAAQAVPTVDQLTNWYQYTIGDAVNFHLAKDRQVNGASATGLKGLCLRADKPFYNPATIVDTLVSGKTLAQLYTDLDAMQAALDAYNQSNPPPPTGADPDAATRLQYSKNMGAILAGIRGMAHWRMSWADVVNNYFQVDSPKYKGNTGANGAEFKPGTINLNTAPLAVLQCLATPASLTTPETETFFKAVIDARKAPKTITGDAILIPDNAGSASIPRQGIAFIGELRSQGLDLDALSWLPQQASCRSDVYCAYVVVQGYKQDDFNLGPMDSRKAIVLYTRGTAGSPATMVRQYIIPSN